MSSILVIGAHGTVGTDLVPRLEARGHRVVRATHRTPQGAHERRLDLVTGEGLATAFDGIDRAFLLSPPGHVNPHELLLPVIDAARTRGLDKIVLMTAMGANADPAAPLRRAELALEASGLAWNIVRPNWFMQNFASYWLQGIREQGAILLPAGRAKGSFVDARDIAAVAAELLDRHDLDGRDFDLTGPEALDHDEVAAILSRASGRTIVYEPITAEAMRPRLLAAGLPPAYAEFMLVILGFFAAGYNARVSDAVPQVTGRAATRFEDWAQAHRAIWAG